MGLIRAEVRRIVDRRQKFPRRIEKRLSALELKIRSLSTAVRVAARRRGPGGGAPAKDAPSGSDLRALRERLGLTRQVLAKRLDVSPSIIFLWESGRSTPSRKTNLEALRKFFKSAGSSAAAPAAAMSGPEIRAVRDRLGLSREKFAKRAGVSPSMIFLWESGRSTPRRRTNIDKLQQLAAESRRGAGRPRGRRRSTARRRR
jgi:DNA-binding transcriptional regulator YiaG